MHTTEPRRSSPVFRHQALLYAGHQDFLNGTVSFIRDGLAADEPILVVVDENKIAALRTELGDDADRLQFADMTEVGRNPARILYRWHLFAQEHLRVGRPVRGVGEPVWAGRSPAELVECQAHENLVNVAFADSPSWRLLCPYDVAALQPAVIEEAHRSHPYLVRNGAEQVSPDFADGPPPPAATDQPLPPPPAGVESVAFGPGARTLRTVRAVVLSHARRAGLDPAATEGLMIGAHEVATNSLQHGAGFGMIGIWRDNGSLICQIADAGRVTNNDPLLGRFPAKVDQHRGRGLWLAHQLCDLVQIRNTTAGTTVRLHVAPRKRSYRS